MATWDILDEDCAGIGDWVNYDQGTGVSEVSPAGQFRLDSNLSAPENDFASIYRILASPPDKFVIEVRTYFDNIGIVASLDCFRVMYTTTTWWFDARFGTDGLFIRKAGGAFGEVGTNIVAEGIWRTWRFEVDKSAGEANATVEVFRDDVSQGTVDCDYTTGWTDGRFHLYTYGYVTNNQVSHVDWVRVRNATPDAPSNCVSSYVATNNAKCTWIDNSTNETGFRIEKDIDGAGFSFWKDVGANVQDSGTYTLGANHRIRFRVRAYNTADVSAYSTSGYTYTTPSAPSGCTGHYEATDKSHCHWADNSLYESGFDVDYRLNGGSWVNYQTVGANIIVSSTYTVGANKYIEWRVRSYRGSLYSAFSYSGIVYTTPTAPSGATTHYVATNLAKLTWADNSAYEEGFRLEYAYGGADWLFWKNVSPNVTDSGNGNPGANNRAKFRVRAYRGGLYSAWSEGSYIYTIPTAPSGINLSWLAQDETVRVTWADNSAYEQDFDIERAIDAGAFSHIVYDVASPYDDATPSGADHRYAYRVRAKCPDGRLSSWDTSGWIYSTPPAPSGCAISLGTINVTWTDTSAYEDGFKIERELDGGGWSLVETTAAEAEFWADASQPTEANTKYQYRVRAYIGGLYSAYSTSNFLYIQILTESLALKESETCAIASILTENLALKESLPGIGKGIILMESLALLEDLTQYSRGLPLEESLALKEEETASISSLLTENLALLESLPTLERGLTLEEALALLEALTEEDRGLTLQESLALLESLVGEERALTLEEALALLESLPTFERALTLEEALALKEKLAEFGFTLEENLALLEDLPILERGLTLTEALALLESETADVSSVLTESLALKEDLTQLGRALTLEESLALLEDAHAETLLFKVDESGNVIIPSLKDAGDAYVYLDSEGKLHRGAGYP